MSIKQLEQEVTNRSIQRLRDRIDKLQELLETLIAAHSVANEVFIREVVKPVSQGRPPLAVPYQRSEEPKPIDDLDFARQRIEALEKSEMDQAEIIERIHADNHKLREEKVRQTSLAERYAVQINELDGINS